MVTETQRFSAGRFPAPQVAYSETFETRSYEVGRSGVISPGVVLRYLENLATRASDALGFDPYWYQAQGTAWMVREMRILFGALPGLDAALSSATWVSDARRVQANRDYLIADRTSGRLVARAEARWAYLDRASGRPARIAEQIVERMNVGGPAFPPRRIDPAIAWEERTDASFEARFIARAYEADSQRHINNCVYADWIEESALRVVERVLPGDGLPERRARPRFYLIEYLRQALPGDELIVRSWLVGRRSRALLLAHEVAFAASGALVVRARSERLLARPAGAVA